MKAIENLNIPPFTGNFKQNANTGKFSKPLTFNTHNLRTTVPFVTAHLEIFHCTHHPVTPNAWFPFTANSTTTTQKSKRLCG